MRFRIALLAFALPAMADEGMWLYNQFPQAQVKERYRFEVTGSFLDHLRLASARVGGGSGSFVSPRGLLFTNHHVAQRCISKIGSAEHDYMKEGFFASTPAAELKCPDLEVIVLQKIEDVTARVKAAAGKEATAADEVALRRAAIARIEKECAEGGNRCDVVTLFSGERYDLYQYKRYTDIRLVFAPEFPIAFFGGDPDNFTYPRYDLDITFFRAYENGRPAATPHYLKWSAEGAREGDLVFVSGNPGTTSRLQTTAQLAFLRDYQYPQTLARLRAAIARLNAYGAVSEENRRVSQNTLFAMSNTFKGSDGKFAGLRDEALMQRKLAQERELRAAVARDPGLGPAALKVWDEVAAAYRTWAPSESSYQVLERSVGSGSRLFTIARDIVRLTAERTRPNDQRIPEFRDSAMRTLELSLYSPAPITDSLEIALLEGYLTDLRNTLGSDDPVVKSALSGRTPRQAAEACVGTSQLKDVAVRRRLAAGRDAVLRSSDGMIRLALLLDEPARKLRKVHEDTVEGAEVSAAAKIAQYRFRLYGAAEYPDATFTLRLAFGAVKGYRDEAQAAVPWATTFAGLYAKATGRDPYLLPQRWVQARASVDGAVPMNFVSTADITNGNSGSPTVNSRGEIVGIIFDGNLESLPNIFLYGEERGRAVHVASQGIVEALRKVYKTSSLLEELGVGSGRGATD